MRRGGLEPTTPPPSPATLSRQEACGVLSGKMAPCEIFHNQPCYNAELEQPQAFAEGVRKSYPNQAEDESQPRSRIARP